MPTEDQVRAARAENDKLREEIAAKQAENRALVEEANNEYRMQRYAREREDLERQLDNLNKQAPIGIPQPADENAVYADTVQPDAQPEAPSQPPPRPLSTSVPPSTPTDVAIINPQ